MYYYYYYYYYRRQKCRPMTSFWKYKVYVDIHGGSSGRGRHDGLFWLLQKLREASNIIWQYATSCRPVIDCKMNDVGWLVHVKIRFRSALLLDSERLTFKNNCVKGNKLICHFLTPVYCCAPSPEFSLLCSVFHSHALIGSIVILSGSLLKQLHSSCLQFC